MECCDKTLYTGITVELERRVEEHNNSNEKGAKYTRARRPVKLVYHEKVKNRGEARKLEDKIKKMNRASKIRLIESVKIAVKKNKLVIN